MYLPYLAKNVYTYLGKQYLSGIHHAGLHVLQTSTCVLRNEQLVNNNNKHLCPDMKQQHQNIQFTLKTLPIPSVFSISEQYLFQEFSVSLRGLVDEVPHSPPLFAGHHHTCLSKRHCHLHCDTLHFIQDSGPLDVADEQRRHRRREAPNCRLPTRKSWWGGSNVTPQKRQTNSMRRQGLREMLKNHLHPNKTSTSLKPTPAKAA